MLGNTPNRPSKSRTNNLVEINDDLHETYNTNSQIKFKTSMLKSSFCYYSNAYILFEGTIKQLLEGEQSKQQGKQTNKIKRQYLKIAHNLLTV